MNAEEIFEIADQAIFKSKRKRLTDIQKAILIGSYEKQKYEIIAKKYCCEEQHAKNEGKKLWDLLSDVLEEKVTKTNFQAAFERYCRSHSPTPLQPEEAEESKKMSSQTVNTSTQIEINSIRECFSKAIDHLGSEKLHVRIGAIYALEKISNDSSADYWRIIEYLAAFIKVNSQQRQTEGFYNRRISLDIQTALTVIGRRNFKQDPPNATLNLTHINIEGADLSEAYLRRVNLYKANLQRCILFGANLQQTNLSEVNLKGALLDGANLEEAWLDEANLQGADLTGLLNEANPNANFKGAIIFKTDIRRTNLSGVKHLELEQVKSARGDDTTWLPEYLNPYYEEILKHWEKY